MIRSEVPRLVDAGEPVAHLLVFQTLLKGKGEVSLLKCAQPSYLDASGWSHLSLLLLKQGSESEWILLFLCILKEWGTLNWGPISCTTIQMELSYAVTRQQAQHCGKLCLKDVS